MLLSSLLSSRAPSPAPRSIAATPPRGGTDAAGIAPTQAVQAFTDNPINAFRTLRTNVQALAVAATTDGTIYPFVNAARHLDLSSHAAMMATIVKAAGEDAREATAAGWTNDMKAGKVAYNLRVALRQASWNAVARINARSDPDLGGRELSVNVVDDFVALFEKEPKSLPATRVRHALASHWGKGFRVKTSIKPDELLGDFFDYQHTAVAAAYCDVFSCDGRVEAGISAARVGLGRAPPLKRKRHPGGTAGFVADVMSTLA